MARKLEAQFQRYQTRGDVAALADVFDRTAPELLRVARHVARSGIEPEELVQETFLKAIRAAESFDGTRRLLPWLVGILTNSAHNARRKSARSPDAERLTPPSSANTQSTVEASELHSTVDTAIAGMPEPYRAALVLHLTHGMTPAGIAQSLDIPPATARLHVHRGLRQLRKRLPRSVSLGAVVPGVLGSQLATVRQRVLAEAESIGASMTCAGVVTGVGMGVPKLLLVGVSVLLLSIGSAYVVLRSSKAEIEPQSESVGAGAAQAAAALTSDTSRSGAPELVGRAPTRALQLGPPGEGMPAPARGAPGPAAAGGRVFGVVTFDSEDNPRPTAVVILRSLGIVETRTIDGRIHREIESRTTAVDTKGRYAFEDVPPGRYIIVATAPGHYLGPLARPGRSTTATMARPGRPGLLTTGIPQEWTVLITDVTARVERDLLLVRGLDVDVEAVDPDGRSLEGARIQAAAGCFPCQWTPSGTSLTDLGVTDAGGRVRVSGLPPGETWRLTAVKKGWVTRPGETFILGPNSLPDRVRLILDPAPVLSERAPVARAERPGMAPQQAPQRPPQRPPQRASGEVAPARLPTVLISGEIRGPDGKLVPSAQVEATGHGVSRFRPTEAFGGRFKTIAWGAAPFDIHVFWPQAADGTPLPLCAAHVQVTDLSRPLIVRLEPGDSVAGLVVDAEGRPVAGARVIIARVMAMTGEDGAFNAVGLKQGHPELRIYPPKGYCRPAGRPVKVGDQAVRFVLQRAGSVKGRVLDAELQPVVGTRVLATWDRCRRAATATTDGSGEFALGEVPEGQRLRVEVSSPSGRTVSEGVFAGTTDLELVLARGVSLRGAVVDDQGVPVAGVRVAAIAGGRQAGSTTVDDDGRWELKGLSPGPYHVAVLGERVPLPKKAAGVHVAPADGIRLQLLASRTLRGRVRGVDKQGDGRWRIMAFWGEKGSGVSGSMELDGQFHFEALPNSVPITICATNDTNDRYAKWGPAMPGSEALAVPVLKGMSIVVTLDIPQSLEAYRVMVTASARGWMAVGRRLPDGRYAVHGLPPGAYQVKARLFGSAKDLASAVREDVLAGTTDVHLVLSPAQPR